MPRKSYTPKGYTPCQQKIAEWINDSAWKTDIRENANYRCYICTGEERYHYQFVKEQGTTIRMPGEVKDFTTRNGRTFRGKLITYPVNTICGLTLTITRPQQGKSIAAFVASGGRV